MGPPPSCGKKRQRQDALYNLTLSVASKDITPVENACLGRIQVEY